MGTSSSQDSRQSSTEQRGTNIQAQNIDIKATESDINMVGAKLQAQNIALDAAKNVNLIAAQNTAEIKSKNTSSSAGIGVTFGFGEQNGISFQIGANNAKGRADGSETTYDNTQLTATNNLSVKSGSDTNLIGAQLAGKTVEMDVGGKLNIETLQDSSSYESKQTTGGFGVSLCIPPLCYGTTVTGNLSASKQQIDHNYLSAVGQSGIAAGSGGFDIKVAGATDLKGAAITSQADSSKNKLTTSALTYSDLQNQQDTSASSESISLSYSSGASMASTLASNLTNNVLANAMGNTGLPETGSQSGVTQSVISPAQVTITGGDKQSEENVATLTSRDASTANGALKNTLTLQQAQDLQAQQQKAKENAQAAQYIGAVITHAIGDLAQKNDWPEGGWQKTVLHGMAGVIQAKVAGTNVLAGGLAGALNEQLIPLLQAYLVDQGYAKGSADFNALMTAGSTLVGAAIGATSIANTATVNNYLKHPEMEEKRAKLAECATQACREKIEVQYQALSDKNDAERVNTCMNGTKEQCDTKLKESETDWVGLQTDLANLQKKSASATAAIEKAALDAQIKDAQRNLNDWNSLRTDELFVKQQQFGLTVDEQTELLRRVAATTGMTVAGIGSAMSGGGKLAGAGKSPINGSDVPPGKLQAEIDALKRIGESPNGPDLTNKPAGEVLNAAANKAAAAKVNNVTAPVDFDHVIGADYNKNGLPTGGHSVLHGDVRIKPGTETVPDVSGVYKAEPQMLDPTNPSQWIDKPLGANGHTMFPKNWTADRIKVEIDGAWNDPGKTVIGNKWFGKTPSGVKVEGYLSPSTTVFPVYQGAHK
ncbi:hemagglutinin repeat-containing protein [Polaromonas sp.]|uniref:hemagglutinin repeat-containing protein n=1 Tax=Polaromonas sp. TaxID=1869339 RepID=UPI003266E72A